MTIQPALTAEHWKRIEGGGEVVDATNARVYFKGKRKAGMSGTPAISVEPATERHALAALALYGQPFGFTREDVKTLREAEQNYLSINANCSYLAEDYQAQAFFKSLADRIESLLPLEER